MQEAALKAHAPDPDAVLQKAVLRAADYLQLTNAELSQIIGVSEASVSRARNSGAPLSNNPKLRELALLFVRLYRSLDAFMGGDDAMSARWLRAHHLVFEKSPARMIATLPGLIAVTTYLDQSRGIV